MPTYIKGNATSTFGGNVDVPQIITDAPTFRANVGTSFNITQNTPTKVQYDIEQWDTNSNYDNTTYRFTPTVAGYYHFDAVAYWSTAIADQKQIWLALFKNGSAYNYGTIFNTSGSDDASVSVSGLAYMNGTTDYIEVYGRQGDTTARTIYASTTLSVFSGYLVRAV